MDHQQHMPEKTAHKRSPRPVTTKAAPQASAPLPLVTSPGWHELAEEAYHADPCPQPSLSSHVAMTIISKSLMHAWRNHPKSPLFEPSVMGAAANRGSAAHALLFGGKAIEAIVADDFRTATARDARDTVVLDASRCCPRTLRALPR